MNKNYSKLEYAVARLFSSSPKIKNSVKIGYQAINYFFHKKKNKIDLNGMAHTDFTHEYGETFFGYFDKSPVSPDGTKVVYNAINVPTSKKIISYGNLVCKIVVATYPDNNILCELETSSFNYQQGSRLIWLSNEEFIYNSYNSKKDSYEAIIFNIEKKKKIKILPFPVVDLYNNDYYVSIDFDKLAVLRPDYGYFNRIKSNKYTNDICSSIKIICFKTNAILDEIKIENFGFSDYVLNKKFNHIQISPDGNNFSFMFRYFDRNNKRFDELYIYNIKTKKTNRIKTGEIVSHLCWISNYKMFGFISDELNKTGFYEINIETLEINRINQLDSFSDGHPTYDFENNIVYFDSYPDKSRMQGIYSYDFKHDCKKILELYHPLKYFGENRCDLHPRFININNKQLLSVDTLYTGRRTLSIIEIN